MVGAGYDYDDLVKKSKGRYRFVTLIQRRMRELQRGAAPLVEKQASLLETAIEECRAGKVWLVSGEEAEKLREEQTPEIKPPPVKELPPPAKRPGE